MRNPAVALYDFVMGTTLTMRFAVLKAHSEVAQFLQDKAREDPEKFADVLGMSVRRAWFWGLCMGGAAGALVGAVLAGWRP